MATTYKVQVVSEKEWGKLVHRDSRYKNTTESMGFADPIKRVAYVRDTHFDELNKYLVNHEFEHLIENHATDEDEFGIRHKSGSSIGRILAGVGSALAVPFTGGASLIPFMLAQATGQALGSVAGGALGHERALGRSAVTGALSGLGTGAGAGLGSALGGAAGATGMGAGAAAGAGAGAGQAAGQALGQTVTGTGTGPGVLKQIGLAGLTGGVGGAMTGFGGAGNTGSATIKSPTGTGITTSTKGMNTLGSAAPVAPTIALPGAGGTAGSGALAGHGLTNSMFPAGIPGAAPSQAGLGAFKAPSPMTSNPFSGASVASPGGMPPPILPMSTTSNAPSMPSVSNPMAAATTAAAPSAPATPPSSNPLQTIGNFAKSNPLVSGAAVAGIGDMFAPKVQAPDFGSIPSIEDLKAKMGGSLSPLGALGQQQLSARLSSPFSGLQPGAEDSIRNTFQRERQNLISQFKALRPNADLTSDSAFRQSMFTLDQQEADAIANAKQNAYGEFNTTRTNDIASALGVDTQTLNTMVSLAQLDISTIMGKLGVDSAQAQQFKQTWAQIGAAIAGSGVTSGMSTPTPTTPTTP